MRGWDEDRLLAPQARLVRAWLGDPALVADLSWGQVDTKVLHVRARGRDLIVKAAGPGNHHIGREIDAHLGHTAPLVERGQVARMLHFDRELNVLVLEYLDGELVDGGAEEFSPALHLQAGEAIRAFHSQERRLDHDYEARVTHKILSWLDREHRIAPAAERDARRRLTHYRPRPIEVVPTHGDWQPRNWLSHDGELRVIDFGRFEFRPAATDLGRLAVQQWRDEPGLEEAFLRGYGGDPRADEVWRMDLLREAIGTAVWAFQVGDTGFEAQGHRMLAEALERF